jgi:hypothetical protein
MNRSLLAVPGLLLLAAGAALTGAEAPAEGFKPEEGP